MWEQIRSNKRKSVVLVTVMALLLMALGFFAGSAFVPPIESAAGPGRYAGGIFGLMVAMCIWLVLSLTAYFGGSGILMASSKAHPIQKQDHPQLYNVVEEMTIASGLSKMPKIFVIDDMALNAFATGRSPDKAAIAVTAGLLGKLNRDQLQGVVAHEMSHIYNRDVLFMTMIGVMVGSIVMLADVFLRSLWYSGGGRRRSRYSSKGGGQAQLVFMAIAVVMAILAPLLAQIIYFAASRRREYLADARAALLTRYPEGLASALEAISVDPTPLASANRTTAPMYIDNPIKKRSLSALTSTHPPIKERVRILRSMGGNASYSAYQKAWKNVGGAAAGALPASVLLGPSQVDVREPHPEPETKQDPRQQMRQATDVLRKANRFLFMSCVCGLQMKLPPDFKHDHVACPRCGRDVAVPVAQMAVLHQVADAVSKQQTPSATPAGIAEQTAPLEVVRKGKGWMTFKCTCGGTVNLSPGFLGSQATCGTCGRNIRIRNK